MRIDEHCEVLLLLVCPLNNSVIHLIGLSCNSSQNLISKLTHPCSPCLGQQREQIVQIARQDHFQQAGFGCSSIDVTM